MAESPTLDALRADLERALFAYVRAKTAEQNPEDGEPIVTCWVAGYEYETIELAKESATRRGVATPDSQGVSASIGLSVYIGQAFDARD